MIKGGEVKVTVKEKVLRELKRKWHSIDSLQEAVGSVSADRRMRELRNEGINIISKKSTESSKKNMYKVKTK